MNEINKSLYILGKFKYRLPFMLFLFMIVSLIDVMGIGLIGPFVALLGHQGNIIDDYPIFLNLFGFGYDDVDYDQELSAEVEIKGLI